MSTMWQGDDERRHFVIGKLCLATSMSTQLLLIPLNKTKIHSNIYIYIYIYIYIILNII